MNFRYYRCLDCRSQDHPCLKEYGWVFKVTREGTGIGPRDTAWPKMACPVCGKECEKIIGEAYRLNAAFQELDAEAGKPCPRCGRTDCRHIRQAARSLQSCREREKEERSKEEEKPRQEEEYRALIERTETAPAKTREMLGMEARPAPAARSGTGQDYIVAANGRLLTFRLIRGDTTKDVQHDTGGCHIRGALIPGARLLAYKTDSKDSMPLEELYLLRDELFIVEKVKIGRTYWDYWEEPEKGKGVIVEPVLFEKVTQYRSV